MFRRIMICLSAMLVMCGCSATSASAVNAGNASIGDLASLLEQHISVTEEEPKDVIVNLLRLDSDSIVDARAALEEGDSGRMVIIIEAKDNETALEVSDKLNYYLTTLQNSAAQYNPEALERINNGYIYTKDNITLLVISDDIADVKADVASFFRK